MSGGGLVIKLAPNERILINGAVIENGDRRARLAIRSPKASVLRLSDAIHPDDARTPVTRAIHLCQVILSGDLDPAEGRRRLVAALEELSQVFKDADSRDILARATVAAVAENEYLCFKTLRALIPREVRMFAALQ